MKRFFVILNCLCAICFSSYAQRLNGRGEKMIKEFTERNEQAILSRYVYEYDDSNKVKSLTIYNGKNELERIFYKENGKIKQRSYNGDEDCVSYDIRTDENGNVSSVEVVVYDDDKIPMNKYVYEYKYVLDDGKYRFDEIREIEYRFDKDTKKYIKFNHNLTWKLLNENGLYKTENDWSIETDFEHVNDTNVSFHGIINSCINGHWYISPLFLTDWTNIKGDYFPKYIDRVRYWNIYYKYDERGNIILMTKTFDGIIRERVDIKYVE